MPRICVYEKSQVLPTEQELKAGTWVEGRPHMASLQLAQAVVKARLARLLDSKSIQGGIQLLTDESWAGVKQRVCPRKNSILAIVVPHALLPARPFEHPLMLTYPPRNYESDGTRKQRELWLHAERF